MARTRYRLFIIFLLFAITVVNYIDRAAISYAIPLIQRDLGLSPADTGTILGAFGIGYALSTLIGGFAVDRYGGAGRAVVPSSRQGSTDPARRHRLTGRSGGAFCDVTIGRPER